GSAGSAGGAGSAGSASYDVSSQRTSMPTTPVAPAPPASIMLARPRVPTGLVNCPITVSESALVSMRGAPRAVTVRWFHGGGAPVASQRLYFNGRDPVPTTDQWRLGQPHALVRGWFVLQAWTPQAARSTAASFVFRCR
ncbi:MAG: hypothetical protein KGL92_15300, partial [Gammaproteobacteria bacterium]|nr:hypothetical protein [Gammaproteobacteria bacterium]